MQWDLDSCVCHTFTQTLHLQHRQDFSSPGPQKVGFLVHSAPSFALPHDTSTSITLGHGGRQKRDLNFWVSLVASYQRDTRQLVKEEKKAGRSTGTKGAEGQAIQLYPPASHSGGPDQPVHGQPSLSLSSCVGDGDTKRSWR